MIVHSKISSRLIGVSAILLMAFLTLSPLSTAQEIFPICGCSSCTLPMLNRDAGGYKVGDRIIWLEANKSMSQQQACKKVCGEEFPGVCPQCNPDECSSMGTFKEINWNQFKDIKRKMNFKRFKRQCDFDAVAIRKKSRNYAELVDSPPTVGHSCSSTLRHIVGHTIGKDYPFKSPSITSGQSGNGFAVESRNPYKTAFGYRTELSLWDHHEAPVDEGKEYYYSFQFKLDKNFPVPTNFMIINQLHQMPGSYTNHRNGLKPPFSIRVGSSDSGDLKCTIELFSHSSTSVEWEHQYEIQHIYDCGALPRDNWLRVSVFVKPSPMNAGGTVGVDITNMSMGFSPISTTLYTGPLAFNNGQGLRNKIGVYSSAGNKGSYKVTFDNVWVE